MYTCFEIARQEQDTRYLIVSGKKSGAMLGMEDLNWLRLVLSYLSVALENVQLICKLDDKVQHLSGLIPTEEEADNLLWFQKLMLNNQEQERVRLAMDLHDTTMQDLFFLKRSLQLTPDMTPSDMEKHIGKLSDYIDRINRNLD
jgi:two-component system sensor histidine kinase ComP